MDRRKFLALLSAALGLKPPPSGELTLEAIMPSAGVRASVGGLRCSFCNRSQKETTKLIAGPSVYVCNECIALCTELIRAEGRDTPLPCPPARPPRRTASTAVSGSTDPGGYFPTWEEMQGKSRQEIATLLRERAFGDFDPFDDLVDAAEAIRDEPRDGPPAWPRTVADLRGKSREELEEMLRALGAEDDELDRLARQLERAVALAESKWESPPPIVHTRPLLSHELACSFCGKAQAEVKKLIAGPTVYICDECIALCSDIIKEDSLT